MSKVVPEIVKLDLPNKFSFCNFGLEFNGLPPLVDSLFRPAPAILLFRREGFLASLRNEDIGTLRFGCFSILEERKPGLISQVDGSLFSPFVSNGDMPRLFCEMSQVSQEPAYVADSAARPI